MEYERVGVNLPKEFIIKETKSSKQSNERPENKVVMSKILMDNMSETQLDEIIKEAENKKKELKEIELNKKKKEARKNIEHLKEHKDFVLSLIPHSRSSCGENNNGIYLETTDDGRDYYKFRCARCALEEILNGEWGDMFNVSFDVYIEEIK